MIDGAELTRRLVERAVFRSDPVFVVDVGASGGIEGHWHAFGDQLKAIGFDPLISEVARLNDDTADGVRYVAAWVTSSKLRPNDKGPSTDFFSRTSAVRAEQVAGLDYARTYYNAGAEMNLASAQVALDDFFDVSEGTSIDFLKVDTDGSDYDVLVSGDRILSSGGVLGLAVEVQFQGPNSEETGLFANIDSFLRRKGFSLFDLEAHRYSRAALPAPFVYDIPAQTVTGQVSWGDAIYFRDLGDPEYESSWGYSPTAEDVLKLACFFELFGLPDCAAELIFKYPESFGDESQRTSYVDALASESVRSETTYADVLRRFEQDSLERFGSRTDSKPR
jgi:hypothetical protein